MRKLAVYMNDIKAGLLTEDTPGYGYKFSYDPEYLAGKEPPISVNMPKRRESYKSEYLFPLFSNMLPEGTGRKIICRTNKIDEADLFGLLSVMADSDFIGAVNVKRVEE